MNTNDVITLEDAVAWHDDEIVSHKVIFNLLIIDVYKSGRMDIKEVSDELERTRESYTKDQQ